MLFAIDLSAYFCGARPGDLTGSDDLVLVAVSIAIAVLGSYTALDLAGRMRSPENCVRGFWWGLSSVAMGGSIWSMHFVAMLAFSLPIPVAYDAGLTLLSLLAAILVSGVGLYIAGRRPGHAVNLLGGGLFMGIGVATMHYAGMAATQVNAALSFDPGLYSFSIAIAVVASVVALWLAFNIRHGWQKAAASLAMAAAIAGMHYTGMAAAHYTPLPGPLDNDPLPSVPLLAVFVSVATFGMLLTGLVSASADRRLAGQLEREAGRFRKVLDTATDAFISIDAHGRIIFWNAQAEATFGWSHAEAVGRFFYDLITPKNHRDFRIQQMGQFSSAPKDWVFKGRHELTALHRNGHEFPVEVTSCASFVDGDVIMNTFIRDISNRKKFELELISAKERAEDANRAKSLFLANMSHELRTPLNAVIGFSEIIRDDLHGRGVSPIYREYGADINLSGRRLLDLINEILDHAKADAGRLVLREQTCDVGTIIATSVVAVRQAAQAGQVALVVEPADVTPMLFADEARLSQILVNVLSNAVKFTLPGGRVTLRSDVRPDGELVLEVVDTGIGMNAEQIATALSPFGQVDNQFARKFEGSGLGLPIAQRLLALHQGRLEINSAPGAGTTVAIYLPPARIWQPQAAEVT
jgi:PAS domain S-box-containing protein